MNVRCSGCFKIYNSEFGLCPFCGHIPGSAAQEVYHLSPGVVLADRYVIGNVLGFGGFGITYKAWDKKLDTVVAIKEYYPSGIVNRPPNSQNVLVVSGKKKAEFDYGLARFIDEARNMAQFNSNKNIVNIFEYFEANNTAYIIMEFLDGCTLGEYIEENGVFLPLEQSIDIILNVTQALKEIHRCGIIHRDVSPDNIYLCNDGNIKLIDFGAARFSAEHSNNYTIILKPGFAPPEQYEQLSTQGPWTDLYALGATLYYMVTGQKPEESTNRKIKDTLAEPIRINPNIPKHISDAIMKAMALETHMRFASAEVFEMVLRGEKKVVSVGTEKRRKKTAQIIGLSAAFVVVAAVAIIFGMDMVEKQKVVELDPAELTVWYADSGDENEKQAYESIVSEFCETYDTVDINLVAVPEENYAEEIRDALRNNDAPNVFVSDELTDSDLQNAGALFDIVYPERKDDGSLISKIFNVKGRTDCLFLEDYEDNFITGKKLPLGFNTPVVYFNKSMLRQGAMMPEKIVSMQQIMQMVDDDAVIVVNEELESEFASAFGNDFSGNVKTGIKEMFLKGEATVYLSDTSEFYDVRKMSSLSAGIPAVVPMSSEIINSSYTSFWSLYETSSDDENEAAEAFLSFMLSGSAQNKLFVGNSSERALPLNENAMDNFAKTYETFSFVIEEKDDFSF